MEKAPYTTRHGAACGATSRNGFRLLVLSSLSSRALGRLKPQVDAVIPLARFYEGLISDHDPTPTR
jgi:hypothetical protein